MNKNNKSVVDLASDDENVIDISKRRVRASNGIRKTDNVDTSVEVIENVDVDNDDDVIDATPSETKRNTKKRARSDSPDVVDTNNDNGSLLSYFSSSSTAKNTSDEHKKEKRRMKNYEKSDHTNAQQLQRPASTQTRTRASDRQFASSSSSLSTDVHVNNDEITAEEMEKIMYDSYMPDAKRQKDSEASRLRKEQDEEFEIARAIDQSNELHEKEMKEELKRKATFEEQEKKLLQESEEEMINRLKESLPNEPANDKEGIMIIIRLPSMKLKRRFPSDISKVKHLFSFVELNEPKCRGISYSLRIPPILSSSSLSQTSTISSSQLTSNSQPGNEETKAGKQNGEDGVSLTVMDSATILKSNDPDIRDVLLSSLEKQLKGSVLQVLFPF